MPVIEDAVLTASDTVRQYLPNQIAEYLPEKSKSDKHSEATPVPDGNVVDHTSGLANETVPGSSQHTKTFDTSALTPNTNSLPPHDAASVSELSTVAQAGSETSRSSLIEPPVRPSPYDSQLPSYLGPLIRESDSDPTPGIGFISVDTLQANPATGSLEPPPGRGDVSTTSLASEETTKIPAPPVPDKESTPIQDAAVFPSTSSKSVETSPEAPSAPIDTSTVLQKEPQTLFDPTTTNVPASIAPGFDSGLADTPNTSTGAHTNDAASERNGNADASTSDSTDKTRDHDDQDTGKEVDDGETSAHSFTEGPETSKADLPDAANPDNSKELKQPEVVSAARTHPLGGEGAHYGGQLLDKEHYSEIEDRYEKGDKEGKPAVPPKDDKIDGLPTTSGSSATPIHPKESSNLHGKERSLESNSTSGGSRMSGKVSLMSKIKGEAKVISGKLSHNEEKIEEGRRLMGKPVHEVTS